MPGTGFQIRSVGGLPVVSAPGEIDKADVDELRQALLSCMDAKRTTLVVDMSRTTFCHPAGARQLARAHNRVAAGGGELRLVIRAASLMLIFEITGLGRLLPIFTSLDAALAGAPASSHPARRSRARSEPKEPGCS